MYFANPDGSQGRLANKQVLEVTQMLMISDEDVVRFLTDAKNFGSYLINQDIVTNSFESVPGWNLDRRKNIAIWDTLCDFSQEEYLKLAEQAKENEC